MKNKYISKLLKISVVLIYVFIFVSNFAVLGAYDVTSKFNGTISANAVEGRNTISTVLSTVLDVLRIVGIGISLIILMYIGVKFMTAAPSERANIKQYSINYVIGAAILMGASGILTIIKNFSDNVITV